MKNTIKKLNPSNKTPRRLAKRGVNKTKKATQDFRERTRITPKRYADPVKEARNQKKREKEKETVAAKKSLRTVARTAKTTGRLARKVVTRGR